MNITEVRIKNFRKHNVLILPVQHCHGFVGVNGSGKTAVLEAVDLATSSFFRQSSLNEQDFNLADEGNVSIKILFDRYFLLKVPDGFATQSVACQSVDFTATRRSAASPGKALSDPFVAATICEPVRYTLKADLDESLLPDSISLDDLPSSVVKVSEGYEITRKSLTVKKVRDSTLMLSNNELVGFPNIFYFDKNREKQTKRGFGTLFSRITRELNWRYRKGWAPEDVKSIWENFYDLVLGAIDLKKKRQILNTVKERVANILDVKFDDLELSILNLEEPFSAAFFSIRKGLNQIDVTGLGSGVESVLAYCLLQHFSTLSKEACIFLIDEPELHLHPQLQKKLFAEFRSSEHQVIFTTHSPIFVDIASWRGITRFDYSGTPFPKHDKLELQLGGKPVREHLDEIQKWYQHETVFFESDAEIFFAKRILLVEGPAEKYGMPKIATVLELNLADVSVISCNGKEKIKYYALLCHAYEIDAFALYDLDGLAIDAAENKEVREALAEMPCHVFSSSFEEIFGISKKANHRAQKLLTRIDAIETRDDVPEEIQKAFEEIAAWLLGNEN